MEEIKELEIVDPYGFIYITTNMKNGKKYIGQKMFKYNWKNYFGSGVYISKAIKKYGKENFSREIIAIAYSKDELNELEIDYIEKHDAINSKNYYNLVGGGGTIAGYHFSEETKLKMSINRKGKKGKPMSDDTKNKLSQSMKGENNYLYGKHHSEEMKRKLGDPKKGANNSNSRKVICITTGDIFDCILYASEKYNTHASNIIDCCKGRNKSSGKLPNGTKLVWMYLEDYRSA